MIDTARHVPVASQTWDAADAQTAVDEIVADAHARLDQTRFWPAHPQDDGAEDGDTSLYMRHLARTGSTQYDRSLVALRDRLVEAARQHRAAFGDYGLHSSLHFGDFPALLVAMRLRPYPATADAIHPCARQRQ